MMPVRSFRFIAQLALVCTVMSSSGLFVSPCQAQEEYPRLPEAMRTYQVFLLGNTGTASPEDLTPTLDLLKRQLATAGQESAVVFLGDQLHGGGMPEAGAPGRAEAEGQLMPLIEAVRDYAGKVFVIPGDKDGGATNRAEALRRQEAFIEEHLDRGNVFRPNKGAPGPDDVKLNDDIRLVILNTDWLLRDDPEPTDDDGEVETIDVYMQLEDIIKDRHSDDIVFVGHHPIYSNGRYGGHRPPYYLLPGLGTALYAAGRTSGDEQYFSHERNEWMRNTLNSLFSVHDDFIYVSAHDYSLQHFDDEKINKLKNFVVSGSAAQSGYVAKGHDPKATTRSWRPARRALSR
ncbi:MAG: metallophosphoesterase [Bacteroidetes bacterium]|nr:metallophosphoesterase [Bacteroidota bacterium]